MKKNYFLRFKNLWMLVLAAWLGLSAATAQDRRITGRVTDAAGAGIPGATVRVKGTNTGATTDAEGNFGLNVRNASDVLVISTVGYRPVEVTVGNQSSINTNLEEEVSALSEVIVTGYTVDDRRQTTGAVSTVKSKDLTAVPSGNVEQQLQGRVSGVTVITNGQPGTTSQIRVRGFGAFGGNEPLYVVDGIPVGTTDFLNPDDIESTTVLKDAAAASIYGARAANGVIVYTTKKGSREARRLSITYDGLYGVTDPGKGQEMLNPTDFATWTWNAFKNSGWKVGDKEWTHPQFGNGATPVIPKYLVVGSNYGVTSDINLEAERAKYNVDPTKGPIYQVVRANTAGTDWYAAITRMAPMTRHSLGFSGGTDHSRFYVGLGAQQQAGILLYNDFKRYTFRVNTEFDLFKGVRLGQNLQMTYRQVLGQMGGAGGQGVAADENDILSAFRMPSIIPVYDEFGGYAGTAAKGFNNPRNPVAGRNGQRNNRSYDASAFGNVYLEAEPLSGLVFRTSLGGRYVNYSYFFYSRLQYENSENNSAFGYGEGSGHNLSWVLTNTANYKKKFGVHQLDLLLGQEALNTGRGRDMSASGQDPFSTNVNFVNITNTQSRIVNSGLYNGVNFYSLFGRVNYTFNDKYILTGLVRRDGSSRFGANNRYGVFPAFSAAWRISSEPFMQDLAFVSDMKIRGGYGLMGNSNNVDPSNQFSLYGSNIGNSSYDINGTNSSAVPGYYRSRIGNADAKWETSVTKNIGIDATFWRGKLDLIFDIWQKDTRDLLYALPVTAVAGYQASVPSVNIAKMVNKGIDIQLINRGNLAREFKYELNATASFLNNKIVSVAPGVNYLTSINPGFRGINPVRNQVGYSLSAFYGYKVAGLFQSADEIAKLNESALKTSDGKISTYQSGAAPGRFKYVDVNGDNQITDADRTYLGSPVPKFTGGLNIRLMYRSFDIETYMYTSIGNKIFNVSKWFTDFYPSFSGAAISARVKDSWTPSNPNATIPIFESASNFSTNTQSNSFYVEDGSYFRLQNLSVGYNFLPTLTERWGMQKLRIFAAVNNLLTLTRYRGLDPAVGGNADTNFGIDVGNYPMTRSWMVGVNVGF